jgi:hypothetical protein
VLVSDQFAALDPAHHPEANGHTDASRARRRRTRRR